MAKDIYRIQGSTLTKDTITFEVEVKANPDKQHTELGILDHVFKASAIPTDTAIVYIEKNGGKARKVYTEYNGDHNDWYFNFIHDF